MEKILLSIPTVKWKPIPRSHIFLINDFRDQLKKIGEFEFGVVSPDNMKPTAAYELMAEECLKDFDKLVIIEDDNVLPENFYENIRLCTGGKERSFINSYVVNNMETENGEIIAPNSYLGSFEKPVVTEWMLPHTGLKEVDYAGFNGCVIHSDVFKDLGTNLFEVRHYNSGGFAMTWDFYFCKKLRDNGYKVLINTDVVLPHLKKVDITQAFLTAFEYGRNYEKSLNEKDKT